jgi:hypothetical protein
MWGAVKDGIYIQYAPNFFRSGAEWVSITSTGSVIVERGSDDSRLSSSSSQKWMLDHLAAVYQNLSKCLPILWLQPLQSTPKLTPTIWTFHASSNKWRSQPDVRPKLLRVGSVSTLNPSSLDSPWTISIRLSSDRRPASSKPMTISIGIHACMASFFSSSMANTIARATARESERDLRLTRTLDGSELEFFLPGWFGRLRRRRSWICLGCLTRLSRSPLAAPEEGGDVDCRSRERMHCRFFIDKIKIHFADGDGDGDSY